MNRKTVRIAELQDDESSSDYDYPDDYTPRPKRSQAVAAAKRAQRSTDAPEPLTPPATAIPARRQLIAGGMVLLILVFVGAASYQLAQLPSAKPLQITPAQTFVASLVASPAPRTATPAPTATPRTIPAYAAPDGVLLGPVELWRIPTVPRAHYGRDWVQYDVTGSGLVWFRWRDVQDVIDGVALAGPDLAPVAQQPQTGHGLTVTDWVPPESSPVPLATPAAPWPVSAPVAPDPNAPNIKEHFNAPRAPGQDG